MKTRNNIRILRSENMRISGENSADIVIPGMKQTILIEGNLAAADCTDEEDIYYNDEKFSGSKEIKNGDEIKTGSYIINFLDKIIEIQASDERAVETSLSRLESPTPFEGYPDYKRSPRIIKEVEDKKISIEQAKFEKPKSKQKGVLFRRLLPPFIMLSVTVSVGLLMGRGIMMIMSVASTMATVIVAIVQFLSDRSAGSSDLLEQRKRYAEYLLRKRKEIYAAYNAEEKAYDYMYPESSKICRMVSEYSDRIYERDIYDEDFLEISLGRSRKSSHLNIHLNIDEVNGARYEEEKDAFDMRREFSEIMAPVTVNIGQSNLGLVGDKELIHEQLKILITQLTFFHSYRDLEIIFLYDEKYNPDFWQFRWLRHFRIEAINTSGMIDNMGVAEQILAAVHQILKERKNKLDEDKKDKKFLPHFIFIIDEPKFIVNHSIMEYLEKDNKSLGFSIIYTTKTASSLPDNITTVVRLDDRENGLLVIEEGKERNTKLKLSKIDGADLEWYSRNLGSISHVAAISSSIPDSITFFGLYHVTTPAELEIKERWAKSNAAKSLAVPLGLRGPDDIVNLDLHERAHGPHGLVAGTTGSGKSEIIQSYIISLAVNFSPYDIAFLLIDYKGGGMAGLFKNLPHLLGTITNLDGEQSMRAMASIKSELARRQRIFSQYDVNHINAYQRLFKAGEADEPMPHLFIISDEFAELKKEQPDFMKELVSAARIGRSLGVHLILATQKPSGVVDDQIWTNSKFKLALMVQNEQDSKEILKTPDAANITKPGRAYLQVGNNEIYELFQSAWSGAPYSDEKTVEKVDDRIYLINRLGQGKLINNDLSGGVNEKGSRTVTQLDAITDYIHDLYESMDFVEVKRPWLPPLPLELLSEEIVSKADDRSANVDVQIALADIPDEQAQVKYHINMEKEGNIVFFSASGYGKTVFLTSAMLSLAVKNSPAMLNFYILDFGNSGLIMLNKLHHTADYIALDDMERMGKFYKIIDKEISDRKKLFAKKMVQNFEVYNQTSDDKLKAIVIMIDNFGASKEIESFEPFIQKVVRDGVGLGIFVVATASGTNAMRYTTVNGFKNKMVGYLFDETEARNVVGRSEYKVSETKGRIMIKLRRKVCMAQTYIFADCENEVSYNSGIERIIDDLNNTYPDLKAPRIAVLPESLNLPLLVGNYERSGDCISLGLDKNDCKAVGLTREMNPFAIVGDVAKGKTNVLHLIMEQITDKKCYIFDSRSMELFRYKSQENVEYVDSQEMLGGFIESIQSEISVRTEKVKRMVEENPETLPRLLVDRLDPIYIIIDDFDNFVEFTKNSALKIAEILSNADGCAIKVVFTIGANKLKGYDNVSIYAKGATNGILLSAPGNTPLFQTVSTRNYPAFGEGLLMRNGTGQKIMVAKV